MALNCRVCEAKDAEIAFLRQTVSSMLEQKKVETTIIPPMYVNDLGQLIPVQEESTDMPEES